MRTCPSAGPSVLALWLCIMAGTAQAQEQRLVSRQEAARPGSSAASLPASDAPLNARVLLEASETTTLSSPADGRIVALNMSLGNSFGPRAVLVEFECHEQRARVKITGTELDAAQKTYNNKLSMKGLDQASDIEVDLAALEVQKFKEQLALYREQVAQCKVLAPWAGATAKLHVKNHMHVAKGVPIADVVRSGRLKGRAHVPSRLINDVRIGKPMLIDIDETGQTYKARISHVNARVDAVSQTIEVEMVVQEGARGLLPGMSGQLRFDGAGR